MQIIWNGLSLFQIITIPEKNSQVKIVIDPFEKSSGLRLPKLEADILLITNKNVNHSNAQAVSNNPFIIDSPGEYEVKNIFIQGISSTTEKSINTVYTFSSEGIKVCHLGRFLQNELTDEQLEEIGDIDILLIPVGDKDVISAKQAAKIMSQIEPKITIPMHYYVSGLKEKLDPLSNFLKVFGLKSIEPQSKLTIKKKDLPVEEAKIIVLNN